MFVPSWSFVLSDSVKIYIFKAYNLTVLPCVDMHGITIHMKALNYIKLLFTSNQANWFEAMRLHNSIVICYSGENITDPFYLLIQFGEKKLTNQDYKLIYSHLY